MWIGRRRRKVRMFERCPLTKDSPMLRAIILWPMLLLAGCFTVPATRGYQTNGKRVPESIVGTSADKAIVLGSTRIEDALIALAEQTKGPQYGPPMFAPAAKAEAKAPFWMTSLEIGRSLRCFAVGYQLRTGTDVAPFLLSAGPRWEYRRIVLTTDAAGIVVGVETAKFDRSQPDNRFDRTPHGLQGNRFIAAFSDEARQKLRAAGLFPEDQLLLQAQQYADQVENGRPTTATAPASRPLAPQTQPSPLNTRLPYEHPRQQKY